MYGTFLIQVNDISGVQIGQLPKSMMIKKNFFSSPSSTPPWVRLAMPFAWLASHLWCHHKVQAFSHRLYHQFLPIDWPQPWRHSLDERLVLDRWRKLVQCFVCVCGCFHCLELCIFVLVVHCVDHPEHWCFSLDTPPSSFSPFPSAYRFLRELKCVQG